MGSTAQHCSQGKWGEKMESEEVKPYFTKNIIRRKGLAYSSSNIFQRVFQEKDLNGYKGKTCYKKFMRILQQEKSVCV